MKNLFDLTGRTAFLTGPRGNLGPIWKDILEKHGATVFGAGLPEYDLTQPAQRERAVKDCVKLHGPPSILIHNAAIDNPPGSQASFFGDFERIIEVNLTAAVRVTELILPHMEKLPSTTPANITIIGSMLGFVASNPNLYPEGFDKPCAYGASKAALWNFCKNLIVRWAVRRVVCNMLALSAVYGTQDEQFRMRYFDRIPNKRMLTRSDFEREFLCCCTATAEYEQPLFVGGGYTVW